MDIRELRCITTIERVGSLSQAAKELHVSRQAITKTLQLTERQVGTRLFERHKAQLIPTEEGRAFIKGANDILIAFDAFCAEHLHTPTNENASISETTFVREGLSIALVTGGTMGLPNGLFENFLMHHHDVALSVEEMSTDAVLNAVTEGNADIGIIGTHPSLISSFERMRQ